MTMKDDLSFYNVFRARPREETTIWALFFFLLACLIVWSVIIQDNILVVTSSVVFGGIILSFIFDAIVAARARWDLSLALSRLSNIVAEIQEGILVYDHNFRIAVLNKRASELLRVHTSDVLGKTFPLGSPELNSYPMLSQVLYPSLATAIDLKSSPGEYPNVTDISFSNPHQVLRVYSNRLIDAAGDDLGFIKVIYDRTEEEDMLQEKSEFITVAAHQLRTPLTAINWALESLRSEKSLSKESKSFVEAAFLTSQKLSQTVNDLLEAARIEGGKVEYRLEHFDLREAIRSAVEGTEILAKERGISIELFLPEESVSVSGDSQKLGLAFSNIIENGIRYNKKDGSVKVSLTSDAKGAEVVISDTGLGIPKEDIPKLFTKFFRSSNVIRKETEGSGLGLFITKKIVEANNGTIGVSSELGKETTFTITLPLK